MYHAIVQGDGNFVVYAPGDRPIWASNTHGPSENFPYVHLTVQGDGNLVLYNPYNPGQNERPIWASNTCGRDSNPRLVLEDDGNLVLLGSKFERDILWASNSSQILNQGFY